MRQVNSLTIRRLSSRDLRALRFIGEGYEVAQYQLQWAIFGGLSPTVASRFVQRVLVRGLIAAERHAGIGMNRLRLTATGRDSLVDNGEPVERVFTPKRCVAAKDLLHTLRINDLRAVLGKRESPPSDLLPSWTLQRLLATDTIPDLLAVWHGRNGKRAVLACEIDLGTESLGTCFIPKLRRLARSVWESAGESGRVLVLTHGRARLERLVSLTPELPRLVALQLPMESGLRGLQALQERLEV